MEQLYFEAQLCSEITAFKENYNNKYKYTKTYLAGGAYFQGVPIPNETHELEDRNLAQNAKGQCTKRR